MGNDLEAKTTPLLDSFVIVVRRRCRVLEGDKTVAS